VPGVGESTADAALAERLTGVAVAASAAILKVDFGSALKFCRLAEGAIDVYPRLAPTSEWDVAAGHALVVAAGGALFAADGRPLRYGGADNGFRVSGFTAWGDAAAARRILG
jgi:3'(2'), 5'-bisphosphate nucleotidase